MTKVEAEHVLNFNSGKSLEKKQYWCSALTHTYRIRDQALALYTSSPGNSNCNQKINTPGHSRANTLPTQQTQHRVTFPQAGHLKWCVILYLFCICFAPSTLDSEQGPCLLYFLISQPRSHDSYSQVFVKISQGGKFTYLSSDEH